MNESRHHSWNAKPPRPGLLGSPYAVPVMRDRTTMVVQRYLDALGGSGRAETQVRDLLGMAAQRLHVLCASMLRRSYPRLLRPPTSIGADELLSAVVERLIKALRAVRPGNVRQFFALANKHMRWELNDLARRLDQHPAPLPIVDSAVAAPASSASQLSPNSSRILQAIEQLPDEEREAFGLVRIQGLSHPEAAEVLQVSTKTVQRRLHRSLLLLSEALQDLRPREDDAGS